MQLAHLNQQTESMHSLRLLRFAVGIFLILRLISFFWEVPMHLGPNSWIPVGFFSGFDPNLYRLDLYSLCTSDGCTYFLLICAILSGIMMLFEKTGAFGSLLSFIFLLSFLHHDNYLAAAIDRIALQHLFVLNWSALLFLLAPILKLNAFKLADFFRTLVKFQICIIYFFAGWGKIHSDSWLNGEAIQILSQQTALVPSYILSNNFILQKYSAFFSYSGIAFLFGFTFLVHFSRTRKLALFAALSFHLGIFIIFGNLKMISLLMIMGHCVFLKQSEIQRLYLIFNNLKGLLARRTR